jgi:H+/Cl- antiporter ClcA
MGGVIAAVINALIYFAAQGINGGPLLVQTPQAPTPQPLPLPAVLLFSVAPGLAAGVVYWALARFTRTPVRWFLILAGLVFVLFIFGPLDAASGTVAVWALELMHVGAAVPIVWAGLKWPKS